AAAGAHDAARGPVGGVARAGAGKPAPVEAPPRHGKGQAPGIKGQRGVEGGDDPLLEVFQERPKRTADTTDETRGTHGRPPQATGEGESLPHSPSACLCAADQASEILEKRKRRGRTGDLPGPGARRQEQPDERREVVR